MSELVRYDEMCRAIADAHKVDEVKDIRDKARAIELYSRQAKNIDNERWAIEIRNERWAIEIRIRAERRCGQLLAQRERPRGNRHRASHDTTLKDLGISDDQSSRWQKLAAVPQNEFEASFVSPGKASTNGIIKRYARKLRRN